MKVLKSFSELDKILEKNKKILKLKKEIAKLQEESNQNKLDKKVLKYLKEILNFADKNSNINLKKLYDDLYYLQYEFCENEIDDNWQISYEVQQLFFEFQKKLKPSELIKRITDLEELT